MINHLKMDNVGPAASMELEFKNRLNLLTGENGLGKSFLLDTVWWAMTRKWPGELNPKLTSGRRALPSDKKSKAEITFSISPDSDGPCSTSRYQPRAQRWEDLQVRSVPEGLVFYVMTDGSFAVWDSARNFWSTQPTEGVRERPAAYVFSPKDVWDGLQHSDGTCLCNGLIRDWANWQKENGRAFTSLKAVLEKLSPADVELLVPGKLTRISLDDVRDMPTLKMPYGQDVPVVHVASGIRRIICLAYLLVWCWEEHLRANDLLGEEPAIEAVFLIDEVESHLHPRWQRSVIPALMDIIGCLMNSPKVQIIASTHSSTVTRSVEQIFEEKKDAWFDFDLVQREVVITNRQGLL